MPGWGLLRELADLTGLSTQVTGVLTDTYKGPWTYAPGVVERIDAAHLPRIRGARAAARAAACRRARPPARRGGE